jgi:ubiquinone/menaquinone biosynthesis C-methylase UbiE
MSMTHQALVARQFSPRARAYVESEDHAKGADLQRLQAIVKDQPGGRILDLGCGGGHVSFAVAPHAREVVAYDLSADMLDAVRDEATARGLTNVRVEQGIAEVLPFADESFDFVLTRFSAHHWSDLAAGLSGMRRVLKRGGLAIVMDAYAPAAVLYDTFLQTIELLRDPSHIRDYSLAEWIAALKAAGFRPSQPVVGRLRLEFETWIRRIGTPEVQVRAIRALQTQMPQDVMERFAIEADGSFLLDTMTIEAEI